MKRSLLLFSSSKNSEKIATGLKLLHVLSEKRVDDDQDLIVVLMQDAVLLALKNYSDVDFSKVSEAYVLDEHLARRGFAEESLRSPFKLGSYDSIIDLVMKDGTQVIGSF